jgi:hypothetical protein
LDIKLKIWISRKSVPGFSKGFNNNTYELKRYFEDEIIQKRKAVSIIIYFSEFPELRD